MDFERVRPVLERVFLGDTSCPEACRACEPGRSRRRARRRAARRACSRALRSPTTYSMLASAEPVDEQVDRRLEAGRVAEQRRDVAKQDPRNRESPGSPGSATRLAASILQASSKRRKRFGFGRTTLSRAGPGTSSSTACLPAGAFVVMEAPTSLCPEASFMLATVNAERGYAHARIRNLSRRRQQSRRSSGAAIAQARATSAREPGDRVHRRGHDGTPRLRTGARSAQRVVHDRRRRSSKDGSRSRRRTTCRRVRTSHASSRERSTTPRPPARAKRGSTWSTTAAVTVAASRPTTGAASCAPTTWPARSPTASRCTRKAHPEDARAASTASFRINA